MKVAAWILALGSIGLAYGSWATYGFTQPINMRRGK